MRKKQSFQIHMTPLLTLIIVLMIIGLQKHFVAGPVAIVPKNISIPTSHSETMSTPGVQIQVSSYQIWVEDKEILNTKTARMNNVFGDEGKRINPLYVELVSIRERLQKNKTLSPKAAEFSGIANLIIDKSLKYNYLKRIMYTCAAAGFKEVKFVVSGKSR